MKSTTSPGMRRPSSWWVALAGLCLILALGALVSAVIVQRQATNPIGEGEVFLNDAAAVESLIFDAEEPDVAVRVARNTLEIEAVSMLDPDGVVTASSSTPMVGLPLSNQLLMFGASSGRFVAVAGSVDQDIWLDGVRAWPVGSVLYQVVSPVGDENGSILLHYDVAELLGRRAQPGDVPPESLQLFGLGVVLALLFGGILLARGRAARRYRMVLLESELLRRHSDELRKTNLELEKALNAAEEALALVEEKIRIRSEFVLMINHELRTPLTSVITGAQLINGTDLSDQERQSVVESMVHDGNRLLEIIDQILAVARIENRGLSKELSEVPFAELCRSVAEAHPDGIAGHVDHPSFDLTVRTDVRAVSLVVASLVDNAKTHGATNVVIACSTNPDVEPMLEVGRRPPDAVWIAVKDDGPGIDHEFLPRIFEKFEKASLSSGTGLGLYLARMVIEAVQGSISVQSSREGTIFQIALPISSVLEAVGVRS